MGDKLKAVLGSLRFWIATMVMVLTVAEIYFGDSEVLTVIQVWLATVVGIGTLDSVASKVGGNG